MASWPVSGAGMSLSRNTIRIRRRPLRRWARTCLVFSFAITTGSALAAGEFASPVHPVEQPPPPILERIAVEDGISAVALSLDGSRAASRELRWARA